VLAWKSVRRDPMPPGRWTALFFLDEATALAAGHRPCAYCRRDDYLSFGQAWRVALGLPDRPRATEMDARLHSERIDPRIRRQRTWTALPRDLPDGVMVRHRGEPALVREGALRPWTWSGYAAPEPSGRSPVEVLTPPSTVAVLGAGYRPLLHPSAG
jgi:hypothetical protein